RLMALTFWGESRVSKSVHVHESPAVMTIPLVSLAVLSLIGGWVGIPHLLGHPLHIPNLFEHWLSPIVHDVQGHGEALAEWATMGTSVALAGVSASAAYLLYTRHPALPAQWAKRFSAAYQLVLNKYFVDEFYFGALINPLVQFSKMLWAYVDVKIVDRTTYLLSDIVKGSSSTIRLLASGNAQQYALYMVLGLVTAIAWVFMR
ncbi:MAG: NADH-quinone oxidoreductase subunit L, partial [Oligoflexia bacterium]|nr:NADH-quinone oxidoreductase subunit L [Oligoflexia bacterium]